jgi:endonuclease I
MNKILLITLLLSFSTFSQPLNYYANISASASGIQLKQQLSNLITTTHTTNLSYSPGIWNLLEVADRDIEDTTKVLLIYGFNDADGVTKNDRTRLISLRQTGSSIIGFWNREHTFAQSLGTPALGTTFAGADGHHLRAADGQMNTTRNNRPYTYGKGTSKTVGSNNFYPGDEWKGDVARMMMYMYLRYGDQCLPGNVGVGKPVANDPAMIDLFLDWNAEDPVSQFEDNRNTYLGNVSSFYGQGNRNPFIDNPYLATLIWGGTKAENRWPGIFLSTTDFNMLSSVIVYPNPTKNNRIDIQTDTIVDEISLTNVNGQLIKHLKKPKLQNNTYSLENLTNGFYFLKLTANNQSITKKVIVK